MKLTVFTPTYNRAYCLTALYKSLVNQQCKDFLWLVVDDGSTDETKELVNSWIKENKLPIKYIFQENQGMHGAHNTAYANITTKWNVCIDSDDTMADNAVNKILKHADNFDEKRFAGIVGLDADKDGNLIGTKIPEHLSGVKMNELYLKHGVTGDKKIVYRTKIVNSYPSYPLFEGERFVPLDYKYLLIDQDWELKPINEVLCIVEYQLDGSSLNIFKQYIKNPKGFAFSRINRINYGITKKEILKNSIHLVSSSIFAAQLSNLFKTKHTASVLAAIPFGIALSLYIKLKTLRK